MLNDELKELKQEISLIKHPRLNKILESNKIDNIITKVQNFYSNISSKLIIKYNLKDELKQGKIYTIIIAILAFIMLVVISLCSIITVNSILGIALLFSFIRQIIFCITFGYSIIKNKGKMIKKYLSNLFPNSKILKEKKERKKIPLYEEQILYQIEDFIEELNKNKIDINIEKQITIKLKNIIEELKMPVFDFESDYYSLEYKENIQKRLMNLYYLYKSNLIKKEEEINFIELKNDVTEQINELENKVYVKKR